MMWCSDRDLNPGLGLEWPPEKEKARMKGLKHLTPTLSELPVVPGKCLNKSFRLFRSAPAEVAI